MGGGGRMGRARSLLPSPFSPADDDSARLGRHVGAPSYRGRMTTWQAEPLPLFQTPEWARLVGVFDLETTGVDVESDRIVSAHVGVLDVDGRVIDARD